MKIIDGILHIIGPTEMMLEGIHASSEHHYVDFHALITGIAYSVCTYNWLNYWN